MKLLLTLFPMIIAIGGLAQAATIKVGHSLLPGDYLGIGYSHYTNSLVNAKLRLFGESSHKNGLQYSAFGIDLMGEYASNQNEQVLFGCRLGFGVTGQIEREPWVYGSLSPGKKFNYGLIAEITGEWWMSEQMCLSVFGQQQYLFNTSLGNTRFVFGLGLKFHFDNH